MLGRLPLSEVIDLLPGTFYIINPDGKVVLWNTWVERATQLSYAEVETIVATDMFAPEERPKVAARIAQVLEADGLVVVEAGLVAKSGKSTPFLFTGSRLVVDGMPYVVGMGLDISERREHEERLRLLERALHASSNGIFIVRLTEPSNPIVYVNAAFERITGYRAEEVIGCDSDNMCGFMSIPGMDDQEHSLVRTSIAERREVRVTYRNVRKSGQVFWNDLTAAPVANEKGVITHFVGVINDVTESKQRTSLLEHEVNHDALTGLATRSLMCDRLEQALYMAQRNKTLVAVVLVDLDNFKLINDTWGHESGDEILRVVARKMLGSVRDSDTVARLGGDEFVLILANQPSLRYTLRMIERLRRDLTTPVMVKHKEVPVRSSMGVAVFPHDGVTAGELIRAADTAMYHAKMGGRDDVQFFSQDMKVATEAKLRLENHMRHAIERGELFLLFQPTLSLRTEQIVGAEALLRWRHPEQGTLLPASFMLEAEENGAIVPFGEWVFDRVCEVLQRMHERGHGQLAISLNVSFREFSQRGFIDRLRERLVSAQLATGKLSLEVSEASLLRNCELTHAVFDDIARLGITLTVDQFGAGVSSLKNLHQLPVHQLKIDSALIERIGADHSDGVMAKAMIGVGHMLGMEVSAEGVETREQCDFLRQSECDLVQGNFFAPPMALEAFEQLLANSTLPRDPPGRMH